MPFAEDRSIFFADFGTDALFDGATEPKSVIFDAAAERSMLGDLGMTTTSPAIHMATSDVPASPQSRTVAVEGKQYQVAEHEPDGTGMSILYLTRI